MIYITDLQNIVSQWLDRTNNPIQSFEYVNAVNECINDINSLINKAINEELDYQQCRQALDSWEADSYLSSMEAHEAA